MSRSGIKELQDIPNVGKAIEKYFILLEINEPVALIGRDPWKMYHALCDITGRRQDPCLLDVFISAVSYMEGGPPKKWWEYTSERKKKMGANQWDSTTMRGH